jgi:hypothetical protein
MRVEQRAGAQKRRDRRSLAVAGRLKAAQRSIERFHRR